jgi:hypothetical protein
MLLSLPAAEEIRPENLFGEASSRSGQEAHVFQPKLEQKPG